MSDLPIAGDGRFFLRSGPYSVSQMAEAAGIDYKGDQAERMITGVAPLQTAGRDQVSFLDNRKYIAALAQSRAGVVIIHPEMQFRVPSGCAVLTTPEPYRAWAQIAAKFHPKPASTPGRHPSSIIDPTAKVSELAEIGPFVVIGPRAEIGAHCRLGIGTVIGEGVMLGDGTQVGAHCSISHAVIGARVTIFPGVRIGQEGFGFATVMGLTGPSYLTIPQLGRVLIGDDVEIGANTTIDRGSAQDTRIGAGSRLDNLVQIGHNVQIGRACVIVAQVGISGSTVLEDFVVVAGQAGLAGHVRIGRGARIGGQAGVMSDIPAGQEYVGSPAQPAKSFFRQMATLRKLVNERAAARAVKINEAGSD